MDAPLRCTNVFAHLSESACASLQKGLSNRIALSDNRSKQLLILTFKIKNTNFVINIIDLRKGTLHEGL